MPQSGKLSFIFDGVILENPEGPRDGDRIEKKIASEESQAGAGLGEDEY